jgi:prenylcysteine oxidase / farnesylcysteine lyase
VTESNKNMYRATQLFGIDTFDLGEDDSDMGIWDGQKFIITVRLQIVCLAFSQLFSHLPKLTGKGFMGRWWDTLKVLWRYGYRSPTTTSDLVKDMVSRYMTLYSTTHGWSSVEQVSAMLNLTELTATDTASYLLSQGVGAPFVYEFVEAATRVNYGHDIDKIHAVEGLVSMAANGAVGAIGGNFQIFANWLDRSNAKVHLRTTVTAIQRDEDGWRLDVEDTVEPSSFGTTKPFDTVVLAAPHKSTKISFPYSSVKVPPVPYVHLHVTLLTTTSPSPSAAYFNLPEGSAIPSMILTSAEAMRHGASEPDFNSMNYLQKVSADREEWVVKIFSKRRVEDHWLEKVFGKGRVGWVLRHEVGLLSNPPHGCSGCG